jgi:S-DNA-T family DNA segregation ATPase FtsK/SpoIIIE
MRVKGFEKLLCELAQKSRASGIHIVAATQHPSSKVLTGEIRANFPSKVACKVTTQTHSRVVIDRNGAENLLGKGDAMLLDEAGNTFRFRGAYVPHLSSNPRVSRSPGNQIPKGFFAKLLGVVGRG